MKETDLAYLAGVIDSDGSITVGIHPENVKTGDSPRFTELLMVRQADPEAVQLGHELFGGVLKGKPAPRPTSRPLHNWEVCSTVAVAVLRAVRPYLRIKARQADLIFQMRAIKDRGRKANSYCVAETAVRRGKYGGLYSFHPMRLKPEVIQEYYDIVREIRTLNYTRFPRPDLRWSLANRFAVPEVSRALSE